jgi:hypothetical protein
MIESPNLQVQKTLSSVNGIKGVGKHQREDRHQLHDNVQGRTRRVLERVSDSVAHDGGLVDVRSLASQLAAGDSLKQTRR